MRPIAREKTKVPRLSLPLWNERYAAPLAPVSGAEMRARGWDCVDVVFVTGDAYVDHPSFAAAILTRCLEAAGFRVAVLSQPDWRSCAPWRQFGRPRLFFAVSAGNMDSLINHYTANKKVRNDDAYSPGGRIGLRPDRATLAYTQRCREAFQGVPVIAGENFAYAAAPRVIELITHTSTAAVLVPVHVRQAVVQNLPAFPLTEAEMDRVYDLPFTRRPHPSYTEPVPAHEMIKDSVTI